MSNLETLVGYYPDKEYYSRIVAIYQAQSKDDRIVMLNAYRVAVSDPKGGLETVGGYLNYADTALDRRQPRRGGARARARHEGRHRPDRRHESAAPQPGQDAPSHRTRRTLPGESAAAAKNPKGEVDVKVGLGFYSTGDYAQAVEAVRRGITKGGVARLDDANLLLGAALLELGKRDEARAAFEGCESRCTGRESPRTGIAGLWLARTSAH